MVRECCNDRLWGWDLLHVRMTEWEAGFWFANVVKTDCEAGICFVSECPNDRLRGWVLVSECSKDRLWDWVLCCVRMLWTDFAMSGACSVYSVLFFYLILLHFFFSHISAEAIHVWMMWKLCKSVVVEHHSVLWCDCGIPSAQRIYTGDLLWFHVGSSVQQGSLCKHWPIYRLSRKQIMNIQNAWTLSLWPIHLAK
jgi:hypothetical protein